MLKEGGRWISSIFKPVNSQIKSLEQALEESLEDFIFSRQEKRNFKQLLAESALNQAQKDWLLSKGRDLAMEKVNENPEQVLAWFYECTKALRSKKAQQKSLTEAYFSPGTACRSAIIHQLRAAQKTIDICVFTISDDLIRDELAAMHKLGKRIRIISDRDKSFDRGSDIHFLRRLGIPIVLDQTEVHMHHKFALFDNEKLLSGSYNWTRSAAEFNYENLVLNNEERLVQSFQQEFEKLWKELA